MTQQQKPTTRAKFSVQSVTDYSTAKQVLLHPVYSDDPNHENKAFWDATPAGLINMTIKSGAADNFRPGMEFYVDFTQAD